MKRGEFYGVMVGGHLTYTGTSLALTEDRLKQDAAEYAHIPFEKGDQPKVVKLRVVPMPSKEAQRKSRAFERRTISTVLRIMEKKRTKAVRVSPKKATGSKKSQARV